LDTTPLKEILDRAYARNPTIYRAGAGDEVLPGRDLRAPKLLSAEKRLVISSCRKKAIWSVTRISEFIFSGDFSFHRLMASFSFISRCVQDGVTVFWFVISAHPKDRQWHPPEMRRCDNRTRHRCVSLCRKTASCFCISFATLWVCWTGPVACSSDQPAGLLPFLAWPTKTVPRAWS
jgi:hypothetical protein